MLTLYYCPYACSMAAHVALEEAGASFTVEKINIFKGEQFSADYRAINHRSKVPALRFADGRVLLESTAILGWIGQAFPESRLLGGDAVSQARTLATCAWLAGTVHPTFKQFVHPELVISDVSQHAAVKARAAEIYWEQLREIDGMLESRPWIMGDEFTVADAYALVFYPWGRELGLPIKELSGLEALKDRVIARPAARRALEREASVLLKL